jgi:hypothetical protein
MMETITLIYIQQELIKDLIDQAQGLVGYWPFDEGSGTIARDYSGNGNDGTLCNGSTCGVQGPTWTTGKVGGALSFDGIPDNTDGDWVNAGPSPSTKLDGTVSIVAWAYPYTPSGNWSYVLRRGFFVDEAYGIRLVSNALSIEYHNGTTFVSFSTDPGTLPYNTWVHIAVVRNLSNRTIRFYINGSLSKTVSYSDNPATNSNQLGLGGHVGSAVQKFKGILDEIRIYNRALSDSEIKVLYEATR